MAKPTNTVTYRFGDSRIEGMPYFLYEVSLYKTDKNMAYLINSKYFKSDKLLNIKKECKKTNDIIQFINLIGAPISFIEENNLSIYKTLKKKKK